MANFRTHITTSGFLGVAYAGGAYVGYDVPLSTCVLAGGLCGVAGMMPDLDSDSGVPLRESMAFAAAVVPMMLVHRFMQLGLSYESIVLAGALIYLAIRFGLSWWLKAYTVHRGMFHSLPAMIIAGEVTFLVASGDDVAIRWFKAGGVMLGYLSHLMLDEYYSLEWRTGRLHVKRSFGTAMKLFGRNAWGNLSAYGKLAVLTFIVVYEPGWMLNWRNDREQAWNDRVARERLAAEDRDGQDAKPTKERDVASATTRSQGQTPQSQGVAASHQEPAFTTGDRLGIVAAARSLISAAGRATSGESEARVAPPSPALLPRLAERPQWSWPHDSPTNHAMPDSFDETLRELRPIAPHTGDNDDRTMTDPPRQVPSARDASWREESRGEVSHAAAETPASYGPVEPPPGTRARGRYVPRWPELNGW